MNYTFWNGNNHEMFLVQMVLIVLCFGMIISLTKVKNVLWCTCRL